MHSDWLPRACTEATHLSPNGHPPKRRSNTWQDEEEQAKVWLADQKKEAWEIGVLTAQQSFRYARLDWSQVQIANRVDDWQDKDLLPHMSPKTSRSQAGTQEHAVGRPPCQSRSCWAGPARS